MDYPSPQYSPCQESSHTMDDDHEIEQYFENYTPLSNLPTPPLSTATTPTEEFTHITPSLLAPAIHLTKLIPPAASRTPLCPSILAEHLARSNLPLTTLAFAACILDALSSSFIRAWRAALIALPGTSGASTSRPRARSSALSASYHWKPELIALAALCVAKGYVEDVAAGARWWAEGVARGAVGVEELDATVRVLLKDIGYELGGILAEDVECMARAMRRGVEFHEGLRERSGV